MLTHVGSPKRVINCAVVTLCLHTASTESRTVQSTYHDLGKGRSPTKVVTVAATSGDEWRRPHHQQRHQGEVTTGPGQRAGRGEHP